MIENYTQLMDQMPDEPMGEEARVNLDSLELDVSLEVEIEEEEQTSTSAWVAKGSKMQKIVHIPERVRSITLQKMPRKS